MNREFLVTEAREFVGKFAGENNGEFSSHEWEDETSRRRQMPQRTDRVRRHADVRRQSRPQPLRSPVAREYVRWVQSTLNQLMGLRLPLDGLMAPATRSALRSFQARQGLIVDGIVGPDTERALLGTRAGSPLPQSGDQQSADEEFALFETAMSRTPGEGEMNRNSQEYARWVQQALNKLMGLRLAVDGIIGPLTRSAIRSFQQKYGLLVDGIVGAQTESALVANGANNPPNSLSTYGSFSSIDEKAKTFVFLTNRLGGNKLEVHYKHEEPPPAVARYTWETVALSIFDDMPELLKVVDRSGDIWMRFDFAVGWTFWTKRKPGGKPDLVVEPTTAQSFNEIMFLLRQPPVASISIELSDAPETSSAEGRAFLWLVSHRSEIVKAEQMYSVDRRAIAGAIAWEALCNPWPTFGLGIARFSGPGKVHYKEFYTSEGEPTAKVVETLGRLPRKTMEERRRVVATSQGAITYIGVIMHEIARLALPAGYYLNCDPPMLTTFYNSWDFDEIQRHFHNPMKLTRAPAPLTPNDMGNWVQGNIAFLEKAVGKPFASLCARPRGY